MKEKQGSDSLVNETNNMNQINTFNLQRKKAVEKKIKKWRDSLSEISYEQSLNELDLLLGKLQSDDVPVDELQELYLRANLYINHCEELLNIYEQEVVEINLDSLTE